MEHIWTKSTLGHGNQMCSRCSITDLEAIALHQFNECQPTSSLEDRIERDRPMNTLKLQFALEKETKGAVRYQELDVNGGVAATYHLGSIYIRKASLPVPPPAKLEVEVKWS